MNIEIKKIEEPLVPITDIKPMEIYRLPNHEGGGLMLMVDQNLEAHRWDRHVRDNGHTMGITLDNNNCRHVAGIVYAHAKAAKVHRVKSAKLTVEL